MAAITLTLGDVSENHPGMKKQGAMVASGFSIEQLEHASEVFQSKGAFCELMRLDQTAGLPPAALLVVRNGVNVVLGNLEAADALLAEQQQLDVDTMALMRGRVVNKLARHNLCFAEEECEPDYASGQGRVVSYQDVPLLQRLRAQLPEYLGEQATDLQTEGNYYYDIRKCGIGFHGDGERRIVVAIRLGQSIPLHYQWFHRGLPVGTRIIVDPPLKHGDMYVMSEKAVGTDWRRSSIFTLRHAAGCQKYLTIASK